MDEKLAQSLAQRKLDIQHKQQMDKLSSLENSVVSTMRQLVKFIDGKVTKTEVVNQLKSVSTPDIDKVVDALNKLDSNTTKNKLDLSPLQKCLEDIEHKLDKLPTEYPEMPEGIEEVTVKNQIDLKPLEKAIKALELKSPDVNVASPTVKVDAPDLKPLQDSLLDIVKSVEAQKYPETDLSKVEKKLDETNKHLKKIVDKPVGGGGGGGGGTSFQNAEGNLVYAELEADGSIPVTIVAGGGGSSSTRWALYADARQDLSGDPMYFGKEDATGNWVIKQFGITSTETKYFEGTGGISSNWAGRAGYTYVEFKDL